MTNREFYTAIAATETLSDEIREHATAEIAKLDATNEKRRNTPTKTQKENAPLMDQIANEILTAEPKTATDVADVLGVSVQKASALCRALVTAGRAAVTDVKVAKKGMQKAYTLPVDAE